MSERTGNQKIHTGVQIYEVQYSHYDNQSYKSTEYTGISTCTILWQILTKVMYRNTLKLSNQVHLEGLWLKVFLSISMWLLSHLGCLYKQCSIIYLLSIVYHGHSMRMKLTTNDIKAGIKMNNNFFTAWIHKNTNAKDWKFNVGNDLWPPA